MIGLSRVYSRWAINQGDMEVYDLHGYWERLPQQTLAASCYWANTHLYKYSTTALDVVHIHRVSHCMEISHLTLWLEVENKGCSPAGDCTRSFYYLWWPFQLHCVWPEFESKALKVRHHDGGDVQRCLGMQLSGRKANTSYWALTILTSQIIPCLPPSSVDPRLYQFELLEFYPGCLSGVQAAQPI